MNVIGLDIGGANIKCADPDGRTVSAAFQMWQESHRLEGELKRLAGQFQAPDLIGLTMTAELADCFATKQDGVQFVIAAVQGAFPGTPVRCWLTSGEFAEPHDALDLFEFVAAANWHALATWMSRAVIEGPAILVDMGSTTTDIIPLLDGLPIPVGRTDLQRLQSSELLYTGSFRTPICSLLREVTIAGGRCQLAAEFFATIADALVVAGVTSEQPECRETADNRPLTFEFCANRLAHQVCCDSTELDPDEIAAIADAAVQGQRQLLLDGLRVVATRLSAELQQAGRSVENEGILLMLSGGGTPVVRHHLGGTEFTAERMKTMSLVEMAGCDVAESACAFAVARLAHDLCRDDLIAEFDQPDFLRL